MGSHCKPFNAQNKLGLALLLALRSLRRSGTEADLPVPDTGVPPEIMSGTLTINPDWTLVLRLKVENNEGGLISMSTVPGVIVSEGNTIRASFASAATPNESG